MSKQIEKLIYEIMETIETSDVVMKIKADEERVVKMMNIACSILVNMMAKHSHSCKKHDNYFNFSQNALLILESLSVRFKNILFDIENSGDCRQGLH